MRKLISKIKKVVVLIIGVIIALPSKIFAYTYKIPTAVPVYGIPEPKPIEVIWKYARVTIIPLALIVGLIIYLKKRKKRENSKKKKVYLNKMYLKKSRSSIKKKAIVMILIIVIVALIYYIINQII